MGKKSIYLILFVLLSFSVIGYTIPYPFHFMNGTVTDNSPYTAHPIGSTNNPEHLFDGFYATINLDSSANIPTGNLYFQRLPLNLSIEFDELQCFNDSLVLFEEVGAYALKKYKIYDNSTGTPILIYTENNAFMGNDEITPIHLHMNTGNRCYNNMLIELIETKTNQSYDGGVYWYPSLITFYVNDTLAYSNNNIPTLELENITVPCINTSINNLLTFDINAVDNEGDLIYYALDNRTIFKTNVNYKYDFAKITGGQCVFDNSFFSSPYIMNNNTYVTPSFFNIFIEHQILGESGLGLFNDVCGAQISLKPNMNTFYLQNVLTSQANYSQRVEFIVNPESYFELTFYNELDAIYRKIGFNYTGTNLSIFDNNTKVFSHTYNKERIAFELFGFSGDNFIQYFANSLAWSISDYTSPEYNYSRYKKVGFTVSENNQNNIIVGYLNLVSTDLGSYYSWSTNKPNNLTLSYNGLNYIKLYVTDEIHKDLGQYNTYTKAIYLQKCELTQASSPNDADYISAFVSLRGGIKSVCSSLDAGLNASGWFCRFFNLIAIIIGVILGLMVASITLDLSLFLVGFGIGVISTSLFLPLSDTLIYVAGFGFAFGLAIFIIKLFSGGSQIQNNNGGAGGSSE